MKTKAVTAEKIYGNIKKYNLITENMPSTVLGVWVINHKFESTKLEEDLRIEGEYEVNVWYSYGDNTKTDVVTKVIAYKEVVPNIFNDTSDYYLKSLGIPNCQKTYIEHEKLIVEVSKQFEIEIVNEIDLKIDGENKIIEEVEKPKKIEPLEIHHNIKQVKEIGDRE